MRQGGPSRSVPPFKLPQASWGLGNTAVLVLSSSSSSTSSPAVSLPPPSTQNHAVPGVAASSRQLSAYKSRRADATPQPESSSSSRPTCHCRTDASGRTEAWSDDICAIEVEVVDRAVSERADEAGYTRAEALETLDLHYGGYVFRGASLSLHALLVSL